MRPAVLTRGIHLHDVRMVQRRRRHRLVLETREEIRVGRIVRRQQLQRDDAIQGKLPRLENRAHRALAELLDDREFAELLWFRCCHQNGR